ncbi:hypothetical protein H7X87_04535 [Acetobacteraceae bacterium]|nr:hypothetical protein [Candidatus Parcubacteria bacterium]
MEPNLQKQIEARIAELPKDVHDAVLSANLGNQLQIIGTRHQLHIDQVGALEDEVMLVMLGFVEAGTFVEQLQNQLHIPQEKARELAADVSDEVFMPIRESMKQFIENRGISAIQTQTNTAREEPAAIPPPQKPPEATSSAEMHPADVVLTQKTVSVPPSPIPQKPIEGPTSNIYKTDPYREPVE